MSRHRYTARCSWRGSTAVGYEGYDRSHAGSAPPAEASLRLASDPAFRGDPRLLNPEDDRPVRITRIALRPRIVVAAGPSEERVRRLVETAHRECYVSNSLRTEVEVTPSVAFR